MDFIVSIDHAVMAHLLAMTPSDYHYFLKQNGLENLVVVNKEDYWYILRLLRQEPTDTPTGAAAERLRRYPLFSR